MQFATQAYFAYVFTTLLVLIQLALADFDMYIVTGGNWILFDDTPDCKIFDLKDIMHNSNDVSKTWGVRCANKGKEPGICDFHTDSWDFKAFEMHFTKHPPWHFTIYESDKKHPGVNEAVMPLKGTDNTVWGNCYTTLRGRDTHKFTCPDRKNSNRFMIDGERRFRCLADVTAKQINDKRRDEMW